MIKGGNMNVSTAFLHKKLRLMQFLKCEISAGRKKCFSPGVVDGNPLCWSGPSIADHRSYNTGQRSQRSYCKNILFLLYHKRCQTYKLKFKCMVIGQSILSQIFTIKGQPELDIFFYSQNSFACILDLLQGYKYW